ncbi:MAG: hypothetical protein K0R27_889 [Xanthobacteraceae bacterium]|jgi:hypothetical protein|nr:hypothetical protein [Xanthobacteraceae bacterium]
MTTQFPRIEAAALHRLLPGESEIASAPLRNCHREDAADDHRDTDELE